MKIAYFLDIPDGLGGAGNLLIQQAGVMSQIHEVVVVIPCDEKGNSNEEYIRRCEDKGLIYKILHYETSFNFYNIDFLKAISSKAVIKKFAIEEGIVFFHSVQLNPAVEMVSRELKIPHLMNIYSLQEEEFNLAYADIYAHYHLCDSDLYAKRWSTLLNIESRSVRPVAPLECMKYKNHAPKRSYKIAVLGNVCAGKNQLSAIMAVEKCLEMYDITIEIAGYLSDGYAETCRSYVDQHHLHDVVRFRGFVSDISGLLEESDILLCASTNESFPLSIVEAVTYDLTIISTPVAGVPELFKDKYNAYISNGFRAEDIAAAVMECIRDYENGNIFMIHQNARQTWENHFSPKAVCREIEQYYTRIMNAGNIGDMCVYEQIPVNQMQDLSIAFKSIEDFSYSIYKRIFYYIYLKNVMTEGNVYIWGAGNFGRQAYELIRLLELKLEVIAFIDTKKSGTYCGRPIISPNEIDYDKADYFFISFAVGRDEVIDYLNKKGIAYNRQSFLLP